VIRNNTPRPKSAVCILTVHILGSRAKYAHGTSMINEIILCIIHRACVSSIIRTTKIDKINNPQRASTLYIYIRIHTTRARVDPCTPRTIGPSKSICFYANSTYFVLWRIYSIFRVPKIKRTHARTARVYKS